MYMNWWQPNALRSILFPDCSTEWLSCPLSSWPKHEKRHALKDNDASLMAAEKSFVSLSRKHPDPSKPLGDEQAKGRRMAVTQRNCQKTQQMMDFINDHFSNAYICFKGFADGQSHKRAVFKSVGQRDLGRDEILVSQCRKVNVTHRTC